MALKNRHRVNLFECFECGCRMQAPFHAEYCPRCGETENFHWVN